MALNAADRQQVAAVVAERLVHQHETATRLEEMTVPSDAEQVEVSMRTLSGQYPTVASGIGLYNAAVPQCQIDDRGEAVNEPTGVPAELLARWRARPDLWSGAACGPAYGRLVVALDERGWGWLRGVAGQPRMSAARRRMQSRMEELGVPSAGGDPVDHRDPVGAPIMLAEVTGPAPMARVVTLPVTDSAEDFNDATMAALRPQPRWARWLVWSWPAGLDVSPGEISPGVRVLAVQPADGAVLTVDGARLRVMNFARPFGPPPAWLLAAIDGARR